MDGTAFQQDLQPGCRSTRFRLFRLQDEIIRLAGRTDNLLVRLISAPGMWLQRLTTREPDDSMIEVAIASVEAVFDWKAYLKETFGYDVDAWEEEKE